MEKPMPHVDLLELPYFQGISIHELVSLVDQMRPLEFSEGQDLIAEGGDTPLYILTYGQVAVLKEGPDGGLRPIAQLDSPTVLGEIELFCNLRAVSTVRALSRISAFALDRKTFLTLRQEQNTAMSEFIFNVARVACHRLASAEEMLAMRPGSENLPQEREKQFEKMRKGSGANTTTTGVFRIEDLKPK